MVRHSPIIAAELFVIAAMLILAVVLYWRSTDQQRIEEISHMNQMALCSFKHDLEQRAENLEFYIAAVVSGQRPISTGTTIAELERLLKNQQSTLDSLSALQCEQ